MENNDENLKKLLGLLDQDVNADNDSNQLEEWTKLVGKSEDSFSAKFVENTMFKLENPEGKVVEMDFSDKVVHLFKRLAFSGAAAILLLIGYTWFSEGSISTDVLLGFNQVNEAVTDLTLNFYSN